MVAEKENASPHLLTVQEMAKQSGLSEHTLRYYERIGLITPVKRHDSSGHRRYTQEDIAIVENLACLRGTGMSIADIHEFLRLRKLGHSAASEQKALFRSHMQAVSREMEMMEIRHQYLAGKVAYWEAIESGDRDQADAIAKSNAELSKLLRRTKDNL